jgi:ubiquinone/menaquinone biosynthesis C-methylase UbiE
MTKEFKTEITLIFDDVAPRYDSNRFFELSAQKLINLIDHNDIKRMLDVATGTGSIALIAAARYPRAEIEALDISNGMLSQARKKAKEKSLKNIKFRKQDIEKIEERNVKFDIITCGYGLFFLPNMEHTIRKLYNCLNTGGKFMFSTFTKRAFSPHRDLFIDLIKDYGISLPEQISIMLQTPKEIKNLCQKLNIDKFRIKSSKIRYLIDFDDWWSLLNSAGYKGFLKQVGEERMDEFKNQHRKELLKYENSGKILLIADSLYTIMHKQ